MKINKYQFIRLAGSAVKARKRFAIKFYINGKCHILASPNIRENADMWAIMSDWVEKVFAKNESFSAVEVCDIWDSKIITNIKSLEFFIF